MLSLKDIKGQANAVRYLSNNLRDGRTANSYLFCGPEGVGRALCAKAFIASLICRHGGEDASPCLKCPSCLRIYSGDHPDVNWIKPEKNRAIKIESVRKAKDILSLKPFEAEVSVCVIEDAHLMTTQASNAILKVLEEPPGRSMIILISDKKELLLETVISRCAEVRFSPLSVADTRDIILSRCAEMSPEQAFFYASLSQGSPGTALRLFEDNVISKKERILSAVKEAMSSGDARFLNWDTSSKDEMVEDIDLLIMLLRDVVLRREGVDSLVVDGAVKSGELDVVLRENTLDGIYSVIRQLVGLKASLLGNVNPRLAAQVLPGMLAGANGL